MLIGSFNIRGLCNIIKRLRFEILLSRRPLSSSQFKTLSSLKFLPPWCILYGGNPLVSRVSLCLLVLIMVYFLSGVAWKGLTCYPFRVRAILGFAWRGVSLIPHVWWLIFIPSVALLRRGLFGGTYSLKRLPLGKACGVSLEISILLGLFQFYFSYRDLGPFPHR